MTIGPVEYVMLSFPGNRFNGDIAPALRELVDSGTVRIIDLVFVSKDEGGDVVALEYDELEDDLGFQELEGEAGGIMSDEDLELAGEMLEPNSSAALLVWEDKWAARLADAIRDSGGRIVGGERIPHEIVVEAMAGLDAGSSSGEG